MDSSAGDSEETRFRWTGMEEDQTHNHQKSKRQEETPQSLAGSSSPPHPDIPLTL